jgi:hypothetical protein
VNSMHDFNYEGKPNTCLWCGRKLSKTDRWILKFFHAQSCATQFGARMAELGHRLKRDTTPKSLQQLRDKVAEELA